MQIRIRTPTLLRDDFEFEFARFGEKNANHKRESGAFLPLSRFSSLRFWSNRGELDLLALLRLFAARSEETG